MLNFSQIVIPWSHANQAFFVLPDSPPVVRLFLAPQKSQVALETSAIGAFLLRGTRFFWLRAAHGRRSRFCSAGGNRCFVPDEFIGPFVHGDHEIRSRPNFPVEGALVITKSSGRNHATAVHANLDTEFLHGRIARLRPLHWFPHFPTVRSDFSRIRHKIPKTAALYLFYELGHALEVELSAIQHHSSQLGYCPARLVLERVGEPTLPTTTRT